MKTKEEIVEFLFENFGSVYCDNCEHNITGYNCDYCNRKSMGWALSKNEAKRIANWILKE